MACRLTEAILALLMLEAQGFGRLFVGREPPHEPPVIDDDRVKICPFQIESQGDGAPTDGPVTLTVVNEQMNNLELLYFNGHDEKRYCECAVRACSSSEASQQAGLCKRAWRVPSAAQAVHRAADVLTW